MTSAQMFTTRCTLAALGACPTVELLATTEAEWREAAEAAMFQSATAREFADSLRQREIDAWLTANPGAVEIVAEMREALT